MYRPPRLIIEELEPRIAPTAIAGVGVDPEGEGGIQEIPLGPTPPPGQGEIPLGYAADWAEPNGTVGTAYDLGTMSGTVSWPGLTIHTGSDEDWYAFTIAEAGTAEHYVRIYFSHALGDIDMYLFDSVGGLVAFSVSMTDNEEISLDGLAADTYYLDVFGLE